MTKVSGLFSPAHILGTPRFYLIRGAERQLAHPEPLDRKLHHRYFLRPNLHLGNARRHLSATLGACDKRDVARSGCSIVTRTVSGVTRDLSYSRRAVRIASILLVSTVHSSPPPRKQKRDRPLTCDNAPEPSDSGPTRRTIGGAGVTITTPFNPVETRIQVFVKVFSTTNTDR